MFLLLTGHRYIIFYLQPPILDLDHHLKMLGQILNDPEPSPH